MIRNEFRFTLSDFKFLFFRKKCPYCGSRELTKKVEKKYLGRSNSINPSYNMSKVDVYENTIFYECETCKRKYTLKGLGSGELFTESIESDPLSENFILERRKKEFEKLKIWHRRLSNAWLVVALVILFISAWQDQSFNVMFFSPFILFGYGALRFFGR